MDTIMDYETSRDSSGRWQREVPMSSLRDKNSNRTSSANITLGYVLLRPALGRQRSFILPKITALVFCAVVP